MTNERCCFLLPHLALQDDWKVILQQKKKKGSAPFDKAIKFKPEDIRHKSKKKKINKATQTQFVINEPVYTNKLLVEWIMRGAIQPCLVTSTNSWH